MAASRTSIETELPFDLNVGEVLEHWTVAFAIRELIANALDESLITGTADPTITKDPDGRWRIRDFGRGIEYHHLTQNESPEKRRHPGVIGQFGMGLKDALGVFDRRHVRVEIRSPHGDITTHRRSKDQFDDVVTLHALVGPSSDPTFVGTEVILDGVSDDDIDTAKSYFLRYSNDEILETTPSGDVLASPAASASARVYVKGLLVAEEPNFLFSYNITNLTAPLRRALNRERTNVGRGAYTDRVKAILTACESSTVATTLTKDLTAFSSGKQHDELAWRDVALHACRVLATHEDVLFITAKQLEHGTPQIEYAKAEGYRLVVVPDDIARRLASLTNLNGEPLVDLGAYRKRWNDSFEFSFVSRDDLTEAERQWYDLTPTAIELAGGAPAAVAEILVSETMRLDSGGFSVVGVWEPQHQRIVIRRDQLASPRTYFGTLLHELTHARSGETDGTLAFEEALTSLIGALADRLMTSS
ncbi:MAG TPA: ATP-binding protein [Ilumatobacteraceae bacterium]